MSYVRDRAPPDEAVILDTSTLTPGLDDILGMHGMDFVQCAYRRILVRNPDPPGVSFYVARLLTGVPKVRILAEMADSLEARELAVNLPGLTRAMLLLRLSRLPLIGRWLGWILGVDGDSRYDTRLRIVEELLHTQFRQAELARQMPHDDRADPHALIAGSDLFDGIWYREQSPKLGDDIDLIDHYLARGGLEGRSPSERFDGGMYLARYVDVRRSGMNPLIHFLMQGEREGRRSFTVAEAREHREATADLIIKHEIHCLKAPHVSAEVAVLVAHSTDGYVKPFVTAYIGVLRRHGIGVVLVIVASGPVKTVSPETLEALSGFFVREDKGDDFAAWAHVLQLHPELYSASILYLLDDSVFGPLEEAKFTWLIGQVRASAADMIELRDSTDHRNPVHAPFRAFKPKALSSVAFQQFVNESGLPRDHGSDSKDETIALPAKLRAQGVSVAEPFSALDLGATEDAAGELAKWRMITHIGFPFVDLPTLLRARAGETWPAWQQLLEREGYDARHLDSALADIAAPDGDEPVESVASRNGRAALIEGPRDAPGRPLRVAFIGPWNREGDEGIASRGYVSALWHSDFLLNVHPIRHPYHGRPHLTPTVDCLSFSGEADLAIVHLNPDEWPRLLSPKHWEILSGARKIVGAWVCDLELIPKSWRPTIDTMDAIWAPTQYCADVIQRSTKVAVEVVPACLSIRSLSAENSLARALRADMGIPEGQRVILARLDSGESFERQNPTALLAAFEESGLAQEDWVLVIVAGNRLGSSAEEQRFQEEAARASAVILADSPVSLPIMDALLATADIYASAHRSDNMGQEIARAMAHGKSVVATDFGGGRNFLDATCGYPVPFVLKPVKDGLCAEIVTADLAAALRMAANKIADGDFSVGLAARERIGSRNSPREIGLAMQHAAYSLLEIE